MTGKIQTQIAAWREANPSGRLTAPKLKKIIDPACSEANLSYANLSYANLSSANLRSADLSGADLSYADLSYADLRYADLSSANLRSADLSGADLSYADLSYADLRYANLSGADLSSADLSSADLSSADLSGADLSYADLSIFQLRGLPSGEVICWPTPSGWQLRIDRWTGDVEALDALINGDGDWPETQEEEKDKRRPGMQALIAMLRAHQEYHGDYVPSLQQLWGAGKTENPS